MDKRYARDNRLIPIWRLSFVLEFGTSMSAFRNPVLKAVPRVRLFTSYKSGT